MNDVICDCGKCQHDHACCTVFKVPLEPDEVVNFLCDKLPGSPLSVLRKTPDNVCVYFNRENKTCKIWDTRPKACRLYDCAKDERILAIIKDPHVPTPSVSDKFRIIVVVAAVDADKPYSIDPIVIRTDSGAYVPESISVVGPQKELPEVVSMFVKGEVFNAINRITKDKKT